MVLTTLTKNYFCWHYTLAFVDILSIWRNITVFIYHFFSIPVLAQTFFAPWKRIHADRETKGLDLADVASTYFVNFVMRILGALIRSIIIAIGMITLSFVIIAGLVFFIFWILMPFTAVLFLAAGVYLILFK